MTALESANLTTTITLAHAAGAQGFTLTAAHAAGVTIPARPGRAGWAARWADRVADEVLAHLALTESEAALRAYEAYEATRPRKVAADRHGLCLKIELEGCGAHGWAIVARPCRVSASVQPRAGLVRRWFDDPRVVTSAGDEHSFSGTRRATPEEVAYVRDLHGITD